MTYDRAVIKMDVASLAAVNKGDLYHVPEITEIVPTSKKKGLTWRYTFEKPGNDWLGRGYDDTAWNEGPGGFGTKGTPGAVVRTEWKTGDIWIRRAFTLPAGPFKNLSLNVHLDEDAEIYLNGVLAAKVPGYV